MADAIHRNYVITPSVDGSGNMTIAIKTLAGTDPSVSDPVLFKIGDTWRAVTAALSVAINAGANTFNAGASELATKAVGLPCYIGYNSTDGVTFGVARILGAVQYSDFSATATNDKYCAISDITNASASDVYTGIGYFEATLSAGAGYTWSSPGNIKNYAVQETNWLYYVPTITGYSSNPTNTVYRYKVIGKECVVVLREGANGTSNATTKTYTAPFTAKTLTNMVWQFALGAPVDNGSVDPAGFALINSASNSIQVFRSQQANWTGSGGARITTLYITFELL